VNANPRPGRAAAGLFQARTGRLSLPTAGASTVLILIGSGQYGARSTSCDISKSASGSLGEAYRTCRGLGCRIGYRGRGLRTLLGDVT
jgi:hypothetical protein